MPRFQINHITRYTYQFPVRDSANQIMLFPVKDSSQDVLKQELHISGNPLVEIYKDYYANEVGSFMRAEQHSEMAIESIIEVITYKKELPPDTLPLDTQWEELRQLQGQIPYIDFIQPEQFAALPELKEELSRIRVEGQTPLQLTTALTAYVFDRFQYIPGVTNVETTVDEIWKLKAGVCQDFAHIQLVMLRMSGIPARYVSGYVCPNKNGMRGEGATHAWVEALIPSYGWLGFDPTNNCVVNELHVRLAVGRSFTDCSPVKGTYKGAGEHVLEVGVSVSYEEGRPATQSSAILSAQPVRAGGQQNSYRRFKEMMQQQQQQQ